MARSNRRAPNASCPPSPDSAVDPGGQSDDGQSAPGEERLAAQGHHESGDSEERDRRPGEEPPVRGQEHVGEVR